MGKIDFYMLNPYNPERKPFVFWKYFSFVWDSEIELFQFFKNPEIEGGGIDSVISRCKKVPNLIWTS